MIEEEEEEEESLKETSENNTSNERDMKPLKNVLNIRFSLKNPSLWYLLSIPNHMERFRYLPLNRVTRK